MQAHAYRVSFTHPQGGTAAAPLQLNDRNHEEPDNYWESARGCSYLVTLRDSGRHIDSVGEFEGEKGFRHCTRHFASSCCPSCRMGLLGDGGHAAVCGPGTVASLHKGILPALAVKTGQPFC